MTPLSAHDLQAIATALRLATEAVRQTGIRYDGSVDMQITTPSGDYLNTRWVDDSNGGHYVLDLTQY
jgi:hypothetical protein